MRSSVHDKGFVLGTRVWVDGVEITNECHTADDVLGVALGYATDENGKFMLDETGDHIVPEVWFGHVCIHVPEGAA